jgi:pseudouridine-5'-phosphate glycosidase
MEAVRGSGAVPATIALHGGRLLVGLDQRTLEALARVGTARKVARATLAAGLASGDWGGTTVSATMLAADAAGISIFATGGIGGVHRGALGAPGRGSSGSLDISSDLEELARTPVAVVCAGPKALLDLPQTLEYLETRGVPVVTIGEDQMPGFYSRSSGVRSPLTAADVREAARIARVHFATGIRSGLVLCVPIPLTDEIPRERTAGVIDQAIAEADAAGVSGAAVTPWLLKRIAELTGGASVQANVALILNNAPLAGQLAAEMMSEAR